MYGDQHEPEVVQLGQQPVQGGLVGYRAMNDGLAVGMLRSNGLTAVLSADDAGGQEPPLQLQGVRVLVTPSDEAAARQLLAASDDSPS